MNTAPGRYIGTMLSAAPGSWADSEAERTMAYAIFGTPLDTRIWFTEPHGVCWWLFRCLRPEANPIHVWLYEEKWH
jgi:hypothetical protein